MPTSILDTLRSIDRLLEETVTRASHAALTNDRERAKAEAAKIVHAGNNARQLCIYLEEMLVKPKEGDPR